MSPRPRIRPRKALGQNFLRDRRVIDRIIEALEPGPGDLVLEYGCGTGALTRPLIASGARVLGVEVDPRLLEALREDPELEGLELRDEGLENLPPSRVAEECGVERLKLVANLPYQLTSTALFSAAWDAASLERALLMMQREVAARVQSPPGGRSYGILPAVMQARFRVAKVADVAPGAFYPPPKVHSRVLDFRPLDPPRVEDGLWPAYLALVKAVFAERRKKLSSTLKKFYELEPAFLVELSRETGLDLDRRPETLSVEEFLGLTQLLPECRR